MSEDIKSTRLTLEYDEELAKKVQIEETKEEGIEQGLEQGLERVAKEALKRNMSISDIVTLTGLSEKKILKLKQSLAK